MEKPFLLIAGDVYYPNKATGDWIACFETLKEASDAVVELNDGHPWDGKYQINNSRYDWYEIVDLRNWAK